MSTSRIGFHASHEQFAPGELLRCARLAEQAGYAALSCSDHFHPWSAQQGQSGHAWCWLGAALASTALSAGVVTCPFGRYHPAVVAQACATLAAMFPGRFWVAAGSGEALNEHITGRFWPSKAGRQQMLQESVEVMRALWRGEEVDHDGAVRVDRARLYTLPERPPPVFAAALTPQTARWAGGWADGLIMVSGPRDHMRATIEAFHEGAGAARPVYVQAKIAWAPPPGGERAAREMAFEQWRTNVLDSQAAAELATPAAFEARAASVRPQDMDRAVRISADLGRHAAWLAEDFELGAERVFIHNVGTNQQEALAAFAAQVLPRIARAGA
ncbi:MAG TPA: TIGR03885 family FMN-dependent LLM class oxidoreductase [Hydrogenophaga sp.]|uniref:TIGR03885 family FMN-dependent LLM class oxidoreductase n=1 Tax=Hydrogenophaga sp. TaxID=1904254 RepID=UPI002D069B8E|nr:TIGR03885 family FMN-dependent LLM class oxidoreductase [Hydrogenophaga sp.]HSX91969.1 TIGR03885 family FMN-dependent LLM class oxidoreductase [Hydrogenophaga sp.]